jgi:integrase
VKAIKGDQSGSLVDEKSAPEVHRSGSKAGESKADARYWMQGNRLRFHDSADYAMQIQVERRRVWFNLGTPNRKKAAAKAAEIFAYLKAHGYAATAEKFKPKGEDPAKKGKATFGKLIVAATKLSTARRHSLDAYTKALRCIVAEIKGIVAGENTEGMGSAHAAWRAKVDAVPLEAITPADVVGWKNSRLRAAESDPLAKRRAIVTVNSLMRNAKALFGKKLLPFIEQTVSVPRPLPFDGVHFEKPPSMRYVSRVDAFGILAVARQELAASEPEAFKVMLLALVCGLRRSEIDNLLWRSFDFGRKVLRVESNEFHHLKSEDSAGEIDLDDDTVALFRGYRAQHPKSVFVIESPNKPRSETKARCYRCDATFKLVLEWLRAQGVEASKPLHTMRKEIGSIIASEHGIFEASRYLRHSDIRITSAIYADKKKTVTPKAFDGLLGGAAAVEFDKAKEATADTNSKKRKA